MEIKKNITVVNRTIYGGGMRHIDYIVIHYCGSIGWALGVSNYFKSVNRKASAHYVVDEEDIYQIVEDKDAAWHCGDGGRGTMKGKCSNANSIGIEMCVQNPNGNVNSVAADAGWFFDPKTIENTLELVRMLMDKYGIDEDHIIRHYDVTAKWCPAPFVNGQLGWHIDFLNRLEDEMLRYNTVAELPDYAKETVQMLIDKKILSGTGEGLNLSEDMVRILVINDRAGIYGGLK